jgi:Protein of unknown function (DUF3626)
MGAALSAARFQHPAASTDLSLPPDDGDAGPGSEEEERGAIAVTVSPLSFSSQLLQRSLTATLAASLRAVIFEGSWSVPQEGHSPSDPGDPGDPGDDDDSEAEGGTALHVEPEEEPTNPLPAIIIEDPAVRASLSDEELRELREQSGGAARPRDRGQKSPNTLDVASSGLHTSSGSEFSFFNLSQGSVGMSEMESLANSGALGFDWKDEEELADVVVVENDELEHNPLDVPPEGSFLPDLLDQRGLLELNDTQAKAVRYVVKESRRQTQECFDEVLSKATRLGFSEDDLRATLKWIRDEAPILIHVNPTTIIPLLSKDTHYRNQFETNSSHGSLDNSARVGWEDRMFKGTYGRFCSGFDRVKYGVLNTTKDPAGVVSCQGYGDSYFVLRGVRLRTSFADKDSSSSDAQMASCEYYCQVLKNYSDLEFTDCLEVGTGKGNDFSISSCRHSEVSTLNQLTLFPPSQCRSSRRENAKTTRKSKSTAPSDWTGILSASCSTYSTGEPWVSRRSSKTLRNFARSTGAGGAGTTRNGGRRRRQDRIPLGNSYFRLTKRSTSTLSPTPSRPPEQVPRRSGGGGENANGCNLSTSVLMPRRGPQVKWGLPITRASSRQPGRELHLPGHAGLVPLGSQWPVAARLDWAPTFAQSIRQTPPDSQQSRLT